MSKKSRTVKDWINEPWVWRALFILLGAVNMWLTLNFVSVKDDKEFKKLYWDKFSCHEEKIADLKERVKVLEERTHR